MPESDKRKDRLLTESLKRLGSTAHGIFSRLVPFGAQLLISSLSYGTGMCLVQVIGSTLRISCATRVLAPCLGAVGVGAASALSGHISRHLKRRTEEGKGIIEAMVGDSPFWSSRLDINEAVLDAITGLAIFKVTGGSFRRLLPSDLRAPGAFAHQSVPVSAAEYATEAQKGQLIAIFRRDGCHHCGSRAGQVIGDHIPPTKMVEDIKAQRKAVEASLRNLPDMIKKMRYMFLPDKAATTQAYYAQCRRCSQHQSEVMRHGRRSALVLHKWIVAPGFIPGVIVGLRQYCDPPPRVKPKDGDIMFKSAGGQEHQKTAGRRKGIWNWSVPMGEEAALGQDVFCSFEHKGLEPAQ